MPSHHRFAIRAGCALALLLALSAPMFVESQPATRVQRGKASLAPSCTSNTVALYDAGLGGTPDTQGMDYQAFNIPKQTFIVSATQTFSNGATILDTTPQRGDSAGYFGKSTLVPALSRTSGYTLTFSAQVLSEAHTNANRAGLSLIALSSDKKGIELGFWEDHIWAQNDGVTGPITGTLFSHGEDAPFTTTAGLISYTLAIRGETYDLMADGTSILTGALRDYTAFNGFPDVYKTPNFIFLGDDTSSASASIRLAALAVATIECSQPQHIQYLPLVRAGN